MSIPYHQAAERARAAMYSVDVVCECPECGELVECRVDGLDVRILHPCDDACHQRSRYPWDTLTDAALALAASERTAYTHHLRDGGV